LELTEKIRVVAAAVFSTASTDPYATGSSMRALDSLIRSRVAETLAHAAAAVRTQYTDAHQALGHPSRENPFADAEKLRDLEQIKRLSEQLSNLGSLVSALPAPANDRVWQRLRKNRSLLELLIEYDYTLVEHTASLERRVQSANLSDGLNDILAMLDPIKNLLRERSDLLSAVP
jgi:hypothetical protein